ncbi:MAG: hypothetical protein R3F11_28680 [Verrucomicrobiales bacterium]
MHDPQFAAPTRDKLVNPEHRTAVRDTPLAPLLARFVGRWAVASTRRED